LFDSLRPFATDETALLGSFDDDWIYTMELRAFLSFRLCEIAAMTWRHSVDSSADTNTEEEWLAAPASELNIERLSQRAVQRAMSELIPLRSENSLVFVSYSTFDCSDYLQSTCALLDRIVDRVPDRAWLYIYVKALLLQFVCLSPLLDSEFSW
jgi:hypothetical protein